MIKNGKAGKLPLSIKIRSAFREFMRSQVFGILVILLVMGGFLSIFTKTFLTSTNIYNILRAFSWIAISAFGECLVIITGGIDLSVGSVMAFSGLITALLMKLGIYMPVAVLAGLLAGSMAGFLNGIMITKGKLPPFIATLGSLLMFRGLCYGISGGWPVRDFPESFSFFGQYDIPVIGVPIPLVAVILFAIIVGVFLAKTIWGYKIYAVGGNETAANLSGINTERVKLMVYTISGFLASVGGIIMTSRLGVAAPTAASGYELDVIAAAVVGGTSLSGGEGHIFGVLIGALIMQVLRTGLVLIGVSAYWLQAIQGLVIVVAIMFDQLRKQRR